MKLDVETLKLRSLFESVTRARVKDCFKEGETIIFVVQSGEIGKAIGKQGIHVKKMTQMLKKPVLVYEHNEDPVLFLKNLLHLNVHVSLEGKSLIVACPDTKTKGLIYGREKERLKRLLVLVKRYFSIETIVVK